MKKLFYFILLSIALPACSQDSSVDELPEKTTFEGDEYEVFYMLDGVTDNQITGETIMRSVTDSIDVVQAALEDTATALRDYIVTVGQGEGLWSLTTGSYPSITQTGRYNLALGSVSDGFHRYYPLNVYGSMRMTGTLDLTDFVTVKNDGGDLELSDASFSSGVTLSDLYNLNRTITTDATLTFSGDETFTITDFDVFNVSGNTYNNTASEINITGSNYYNSARYSSFDGSISIPYYTIPYTDTVDIDFYSDQRSMKRKLVVTGDCVVNITALPNGGVPTLRIVQDETGGHAITIGTGWGTVFDNTAEFSTDADDINFVQWDNDGTDVLYRISTVAK